MHSENQAQKASDTTTRYTQVEGRLVGVSGAENNQRLLQFCERYQTDSITPNGAEVAIESRENGLTCVWNSALGNSVEMSIDIKRFIGRLKTFPASRRGVLNQAIGRKTKTVLDASGGWGADALLLCSQGYQVTSCERHPLMVLLLEDAMQRLANSEWAEYHQVVTPSVVAADVRDLIEQKPGLQFSDYDCVYFDPMFPPKRKASAAPAKEIQFLKWLLGEQNDAKEIAEELINRGAKRLVIKRPKHAEPLIGEPQQRFSGKLVHYDVYLLA